MISLVEYRALKRNLMLALCRDYMHGKFSARLAEITGLPGCHMHVIVKVIFVALNRRAEISANRASPANLASPAHIIRP